VEDIHATRLEMLGNEARDGDETVGPVSKSAVDLVVIGDVDRGHNRGSGEAAEDVAEVGGAGEVGVKDVDPAGSPLTNHPAEEMIERRAFHRVNGDGEPFARESTGEPTRRGDDNRDPHSASRQGAGELEDVVLGAGGRGR